MLFFHIFYTCCNNIVIVNSFCHGTPVVKNNIVTALILISHWLFSKYVNKLLIFFIEALIVFLYISLRWDRKDLGWRGEESGEVYVNV